MPRLLVGILHLAAIVALADTAPLPAQEAADVRFLRLEQAWMDALTAQDTVQLQRTLAAEFTIVGAGSTADQAVGTRAVTDTWVERAGRWQAVARHASLASPAP